MKFYLKFIPVLLFWLFSTPKLIYQETVSANNYEQNAALSYSEKKYVESYRFEEAYEEAIAFIKTHEGFRNGRIYTDAAGIRTIGYGHRIKPGENFGTKISRQKAEKLLRKDFDKAVWHAERETPLTGYQKVAVAHFIYAKGIGNFRKSTFKKNILSGKPVDETLKRWCYYHNTGGKKIKSKYILKIRLWEIDMYNRA